MSGRCGQDTRLFGFVWVTSMPTDWRPREPQRTSTPSGPSRKSGVRRTVQRRVATVTLHMAEQHTPASPSWCPTSRFTVSAYRWKNASGCPRMRLWRSEGVIRTVHQVLACLRQQASACLAAYDVYSVAGERCSLHPFAARAVSRGPPVELILTRKMLGPSTRRMSARMMFGKRRLRMVTRWEVVTCIHHGGDIVCGKCEGFCMWVIWKLRRECLGNPSKLGSEVLKRMANRETPRPGQEWPLSVDVVPRSRMVVARV